MKALITILVCTFAFSAHAKKYVPKKLNNTNLQKNIKFGDHNVDGQFMFSQEAIATVENDKQLSDLLQLRKNFNDRQTDLSKGY